MNFIHSPSHKLPSERSFGYLFSAIIIILGAYLEHKSHSHSVAAALFLLGGILLAISLLKPALLSPLNRAWFVFGMLLGKIVSPIVLGAIFFLMITPIALLMRINGRDALGLRRKKEVATYWVERAAAEPNAASFKNQF